MHYQSTLKQGILYGITQALSKASTSITSLLPTPTSESLSVLPLKRTGGLLH